MATIKSMGDEESVRSAEVEMLRSMYTEEEIEFPDPEELFSFKVRVRLEDCGSGGGYQTTAVSEECDVFFALPHGYPVEPPHISITYDHLQRKDNDRMLETLRCQLAEDAEEMQVLPAIEWIKSHMSEYIAKGTRHASMKREKSPPVEKKVKGFMREWCSFVSFYKDSYISGPNRFEVMTDLATGRGLNITGMGIAGKPGGMVVEGEENDVVAFMELMRTEFFETLNPRGRKLTTRLQERWPLDQEHDRFEAAEVVLRVRDDTYRAADRASGVAKFKPGERERLEKQEAADLALLKRWEANASRVMDHDEAVKLVEAGPPEKCTVPGVYWKCGFETPPSREEVEAKRIFKDFSIFTGKEGFESSYQDAAKIFKDLGRMDGFDYMFAYRFS